MARPPVTLRITQGTDEANDGTSRFRVAPDGTVTVPAEVADRLLHGGGFIEVVDELPPAPQGWAKLKHPDGSGCSWGGVSYDPDRSGAVTVPSAAVEDLASHGFTPADEQAIDDPEPEPPAEKRAAKAKGAPKTARVKGTRKRRAAAKPAKEPEAPAPEPETPAEE